MSDAVRARDPVPLEIRLAGALPLPPFATGALLAGALALVSVALQARFGSLWAPGAGPGADLLDRLDSDVRASVVLSLLVGYTVAAARWVPVAAWRDLTEAGLRPPPPAEDPDAHLRSPLPVLRRSRWIGFAAVAAGLAVEAVALAVTPTASSASGSIAWGDPGV